MSACPLGLTDPCPATLTGPASHLFLTMINALFASQCGLRAEGRYPADLGPILRDGDEFDFIVVGSGSAGSVVANRLTQIDDWKVLLLEAGTYPSALTEIPAIFFSLIGTPEDWQYVMEPSDTSCISTRGNACSCGKGKVMGGSSSINAMMYIRGNRRDFDGWASLGNEGWDYDSVVEHFRKFENVQSDNDGHYGKQGELQISTYINQNPAREVLINAYKEMGYHKYNELTPLGTLDVFMSTSNGTRSNAAKAFLAPARDRENLFMALNAQVGKLQVEEGSNHVKGVEVKINGEILKVKARKEVILSAGVIGSAQILLNSGIGPKKHLKSLGMKTIHELDVGENLQDHVVFPLVFKIDPSVVNAVSPLQLVDAVYNYFTRREGPLGQIDMSNFMAFVNTKNDSIYPNVQICNSIHPINDPYLLEAITTIFALSQETKDTIMGENKRNAVLIFWIVLLNPKSRGKLLLRDQDPYSHPRIVPNYFTDDREEDIGVLVAAIRLVQDLTQTKSFKPYNLGVLYLDFPGCTTMMKNSQEFWKCQIRNTASHLFHQVGTCRMGPKREHGAVVDAKLRVHGLKGIRVVDASIMPLITSGNTNAPSIMIGEKGAAYVKEDWLSGHDEL